MKRVFFSFLTIALLLPSALSAREVVRLTRYTGQLITGVSADHMFRIQLVKSNETKAVLELDSDLERYLKFDLNSSGVVHVDLVIPQSEKRNYERTGWDRRTLNLTLYLPEVVSIRLMGMTQLDTNDEFNGSTIDIRLEDMAKITKMDLDADKITVKAEDMATASLTLWAQSVVVVADDMAKITLRGEAKDIRAESNDMAKITGDEFKAERASLKASDMAKTSVYVTQYLYARSSDMASVSYKGEPQEIDLRTPRRTIYTKAD